MSQEEVNKLLQTASQKMKSKGIYAVQYNNILEFVNTPMSATKIKEYKRQAKSKGIKVYANM